MGRGARFWPPFPGFAASGAPSIMRTWPVPVSATKPIADRAPELTVQLTVHSIFIDSKGVHAGATGIKKPDADVNLCSKSVTRLLQCNKQSIYFISSHTTPCVPVVSSTLPIGGFSPEPQGPGLFSCGG